MTLIDFYATSLGPSQIEYVTLNTINNVVPILGAHLPISNITLRGVDIFLMNYMIVCTTSEQVYIVLNNIGL